MSKFSIYLKNLIEDSGESISSIRFSMLPPPQVDHIDLTERLLKGEYAVTVCAAAGTPGYPADAPLSVRRDR